MGDPASEKLAIIRLAAGVRLPVKRMLAKPSVLKRHIPLGDPPRSPGRLCQRLPRASPNHAVGFGTVDFRNVGKTGTAKPAAGAHLCAGVACRSG